MNIEWNFILRILVAGLLGGLIGVERAFRAKEAGVRTHFVVALGSALFMVISQYAFSGSFDSSRVAAQVVSGIGFIGAGVIIFQKNAVRGITTAAGLWVAAAVGLACGAGMYDVAAAASIFTIICLEAMHIITYRYGGKSITLGVSPLSAEALGSLLETLRRNGYEVENFTFTAGKASIELRLRMKDYQKSLESLLALCDGSEVEIS